MKDESEEAEARALSLQVIESRSDGVKEPVGRLPTGLELVFPMQLVSPQHRMQRVMGSVGREPHGASTKFKRQSDELSKEP